MKPIIRVENLSKQYRIGAQQASYATLRDSITNAFNSPFKKARNPKPETRNSETLWALKDINFEVMPGEVMGIIGRNGAGKSTLLKILSRITEPTTGKVDLHGRVSSLLEVGTGFHPELTGRENIFLNGAVLGMKRAEITRKFDEIVDFAEIEKFLDTPVKHYSSGMYTRLAFAVAAHLDPEILIVDEVLAVGDVEFQRKCFGKMGTMANSGRTIIFVSHNLTAIDQLCSTGMLLEKGALQCKGQANEVVSHYVGATIESSNCSWVNDELRPDNQLVFLKTARIYGAGNQLSEINNGMGLEFEAQLDIYKPFHFSACLVVKREGQTAFIANTYHLPDKFNIEKPGSYSFKFCIPAYLLNPGNHTISFYIVDARGAHAHYVKQEDFLGFELLDDNARRGGFFTGAWPGAICPLLQFEVTAL